MHNTVKPHSIYLSFNTCMCSSSS